MTKRYHSQHEIMHLFVEQSPDCTSAELRSGNLSFNGPTLTSFGWWMLAHWIGRMQDGKRVLLRNSDRSGHSGFNSDGKQQNILLSALRGREDYVEIGVGHELLKRYIATSEKARREETVAEDWVRLGNESASEPYFAEAQRLRDEAWTNLGKELIHEEIVRLEARTQRYAKPTVHVYLNHAEHNDSGDVGSDISRDARIADLTTERIEALITQFGLGETFTAFELQQKLHKARCVITDSYAKYNDPKRVKARVRAATRGSLVKLRKLVNETFDGKYRRGSYYRASLLSEGYGDTQMSGPNPQADEIIDDAFKDHPVEAEKLIRDFARRIALREIVRAERVRYPDAKAVIERRRYGGNVKTITPDEWRDGKHGNLRYDLSFPEITLVRVEGTGSNREIVTSRGARVPFKDAVRLYQLAAYVRVSGDEGDYGAKYNGTKVGFYRVNSIDAEGNCTIGCHRLCFTEIERLAVREVPHLVKARYPVPMVIS